LWLMIMSILHVISTRGILAPSLDSRSPSAA
jgi:hypothetical protein